LPIIVIEYQPVELGVTVFKFESNLVQDFVISIQESDPKYFDVAQVAQEFGYTGGRTDIIAKTCSGEVIAFEAKLYRWKVALNQAYRNSSFAHYSYVVLPETATQKALKQSSEFETRGIGLCSFSASGLTVEIEASRKKPIQPWITNNALEYIGNKECKAPPFY
jgi:hypothetical protein